jgi:hypothetical protein
VWQQLLHNKYLHGKLFPKFNLNPTTPPFGWGSWGVRRISLKVDRFLGDGTTTRFLEDSWLGASSLDSQYLSLYNIVQHKNVLVADVF